MIEVFVLCVEYDGCGYPVPIESDTCEIAAPITHNITAVNIHTLVISCNSVQTHGLKNREKITDLNLERDVFASCFCVLKLLQRVS